MSELELDAIKAVVRSLADDRDALVAEVERLRAAEQRVREVLTWARARDEELLDLRDRKSTNHALALKLERAAHEVRTVADRLARALDGGGTDG